MFRQLIESIWHYSHAVDTRMELLKQVMDLRKRGIQFPSDIVPQIMRKPHSAADYIHLSTFINPALPVCLIDAGANVGDWTSQFLHFFPKTRVTAFEPVPDTAQKFQEKLKSHRNVVLHRTALSSKNGQSEIWVTHSSGLASLERYTDEANKAYDVDYKKREVIKTARLDDFTLDFGDSQVVMKVDVQGHELALLEGAKATIKKVDVVIAELSFASEYMGMDPSFSEFCNTMQEVGLHPVIFQDFGRSLSNYGFERDVIFVRKTLLNRIWRESEQALAA